MKRYLSLLACALLPLSLPAATIPYTNDFSGTGSNTAFTTESPDASWTVTGGVYQDVFQAGTGSGVSNIASLELTNAGSLSFTMSTQFTVTEIASFTSSTSSSFTVGFGALSSAALFSGSSGNSFYLADFTYFVGHASPTLALGTLRILSQGDDSDFSATNGSASAPGSAANYAIVLDTTYTLTLTGIYTDGDLALSLGLFDASGTTAIGTAATATDTTPLEGTYFGYRNRVGGVSSAGTTIDFDNFAVVPEPHMAVPTALALCGLALILRRRRK